MVDGCGEWPAPGWSFLELALMSFRLALVGFRLTLPSVGSDWRRAAL